MIAPHFLFKNSLRLCDGMIINWEAFIDNFIDVNGYIMKHWQSKLHQPQLADS